MIDRYREYPEPTRAEYLDLVLDFLLGKGLEGCIDRAYRDFCRTLKGGLDLRKQTSQKLKDEFEWLRKNVASQGEFDDWHRRLCTWLQAERKLTVGQAQKWVNMTLKYVYANGEERLPGYLRLYCFGHAPLDNRFLRAVGRFGVKFPSRPWSAWNNYDEYLRVQQEIRAAFCGSAPLAVEFRLWLSEK